MTLESQFAVSAVSPQTSWGYDPDSPHDPHLVAFLSAYGAHSSPMTPTRVDAYGWILTGQVANDELIIGHNPSPADDEDDLVSYPLVTSSIRLRLSLYYFRSDQQLLLVYGLRKQTDAPLEVAQFFVGYEWVRTEKIDDDVETIALLLDVPETDDWQFIEVFLRLGSNRAYSALALTGIDGYVL